MSSPNEISKSSYSLIDPAGAVRAKLNLVNGEPTLALYDIHCNPRLELRVKEDGLPQILLYGIPKVGPTLKVECDEHGSHVLLASAGRQESYLFLKKVGGSGLVLFGAAGQRQLEILLTEEGDARWTLWDAAGEVTATSQSKT